jgi:hypothetical protein
VADLTGRQGGQAFAQIGLAPPWVGGMSGGSGGLLALEQR